MNTLIKFALVISSVAATYSANATLKEESQDTVVLNNADVVVMLGDELKVNTMALRNDIKFTQPLITQPILITKRTSRIEYTGQLPAMRAVYKPQ